MAATVLAFGPLYGFAYAWVATLVSSSVNFWLGRFFGADLLQRFGDLSAAWILQALGPLLVIVLGWAWLTRKASSRRAMMLEQLPGYLEATMRVLAAGNTLEESLALAAREAPAPLQPLMMSVGRQVRLGAPTDAVLM